MADQQHTPGPWLMSAQPSSVVGWPIVATPSGRSVANVRGSDLQSKANAHLIAAAPELLVALSQIIEACATKEYRDPLTHAEIANIAQTAIAKAAGRA